jgi:hypothetical protein
MALRHLSFGLLHNEDQDCGPYLAQVALIVAIPYEAATARRLLASSSYRISLSCAANRDQYLLGDFKKDTSRVLVKWLSETCREGRMSTGLSFAAASTIAPDYPRYRSQRRTRLSGSNKNYDSTNTKCTDRMKPTKNEFAAHITHSAIAGRWRLRWSFSKCIDLTADSSDEERPSLYGERAGRAVSRRLGLNELEWRSQLPAVW